MAAWYAVDRYGIVTRAVPHLIAHPFMVGLDIAFGASLVMCLIAAAASWMRGGKYVYADEHGAAEPVTTEEVEAAFLEGDTVLA